MREKRRLFFKGGVQAEITGLGRERFFNIAARRELFVTGIGTDRDGHVLFWTTGEDYKKMKPAARKAGVRLFLRKKYGLPFFSGTESGSHWLPDSSASSFCCTACPFLYGTFPLRET